MKTIQLDGIDICKTDYPHGARVFAFNSTIDYNGQKSPFGVIVFAVQKKRDLLELGLHKEELDSVWALEDGEKYDSNDYGNSASIVRLA